MVVVNCSFWFCVGFVMLFDDCLVFNSIAYLLYRIRVVLFVLFRVVWVVCWCLLIFVCLVTGCSLWFVVE